MPALAALGRSCLYFQHRPVALCSNPLRFCQPGVPDPANFHPGSSSKQVSTIPRAPRSIRHSPRPRPRIRIPQRFPELGIRRRSTALYYLPTLYVYVRMQ
ncbi:hypothetical protein CORC01_08062 [Colletotrichum orchidophilum]|uniref:Uncharacterized protein n=1 Tax=Colletotrichum orchidophilum TaxID=1209926 RepID=A0A1G4B5P7_9PEZI|nr:uncharacterized protein CORC01_08062 [Colletotrichum orchidophilum]OHE96605.1 hypothetical protein CORC01_08062 [Colletotrichum orchidophilum]